jgi:hypothetical protein
VAPIRELKRKDEAEPLNQLSEQQLGNMLDGLLASFEEEEE